jgi:polyisoprenoid-binding protein YceI
MPPFRRTAGFSATTSLSRAAFGADAWGSLIGDQVTLRIEAEARRTGGDPEAPLEDPATP